MLDAYADHARLSSTVLVVPRHVTITRLAREDLDIAGVTVRKGELIALPSALYNLDAARFADPLDVDLARRIESSCTFGNGVHCCPGANLACAEMRIILEEWLRSFPTSRWRRAPRRWSARVRGPGQRTSSVRRAVARRVGEEVTA